ncbi:iron chelate uptake ABC transporter family permease subunit [Dietzia maris]|uniref:iron chelate uptake ABC transporter family permease subunit n=1 Tax=Dietzia TaxID=37914 RepID=UPI000BDF2B7C|nr:MULTISPECIES: iron chelate uptake ABC transporter family permease subunit [Dietzia]MCZ4538664.1 iron chelate uptake ABC transporter family permease subunit [Dietzia maris]MCZ4655076.1 iron chelate uptake ABC transporter family permease subunit [Dietzia kunjamensis]MDV3355157.1 iron chelate uptake ABC transporter family permease subunit [Dietzia sp. IN118]
MPETAILVAPPESLTRGRTRAEADHRRRWIVTLVCAVAAVAALAALVLSGLPDTVGSRAWSYSLDRLSRHAVAIVLVSVAVGVSTVIFQTVTGNRILTPALMGFDSLYLLIQTLLVFFMIPRDAAVIGGLTSGGLSGFLGQTAIMVVASTSLYLWLLGGRRTDIHLLLLVGVVFGVFFRSASSFFQRLLDPAAYLQVQDAMFASFRGVQLDVLVACGVIVVGGLVAVAILGRRLDVMLLGRDPAVALGVNHRRVTIVVLVVVSFLVSASTALIGPVMFFGLIVANAAYALLGTTLHRFTLPVASLLGVIALAGGEMVLGALGVESALSIVIEFAGGLLFLFLLLTNRAR